MGYMKEKAIKENKRVIGLGTLDIKSNYIFCPAFCRNCIRFKEEESNWPFHCRAASNAVSHCSAKEGYRQYDYCPQYKDRESSKTKSSTNNEAESVIVGLIFTIFARALKSLFNKTIKQTSEDIGKQEKSPGMLKVFGRILKIIFKIFYWLVVFSGWYGIIIINDDYAKSNRKILLIIFTILTIVPIIIGIIKKLKNRK